MEEGKEKWIRMKEYGRTVISGVMMRETLRSLVSFRLRSWFPAMVKIKALVCVNAFAVSQNIPSTLGRPAPMDGLL